MTLPITLNQCGVNATWTVEVGSPASSDNSVRSAVNTASQLLYPADPKRRYRLSDISWSFTQTLALMPTGVFLIIQLNPGGVVYQLEIADPAPRSVAFRTPLQIGYNTEMKITMGAGGAGRVSCLNANVCTYGAEV